jgi:hypothetical protein
VGHRGRVQPGDAQAFFEDHAAGQEADAGDDVGHDLQRVRTGSDERRHQHKEAGAGGDERIRA